MSTVLLQHRGRQPWKCQDLICMYLPHHNMSYHICYQQVQDATAGKLARLEAKLQASQQEKGQQQQSAQQLQSQLEVSCRWAVQQNHNAILLPEAMHLCTEAHCPSACRLSASLHNAAQFCSNLAISKLIMLPGMPRTVKVVMLAPV